jgi:hypothetical protein
MKKKKLKNKVVLSFEPKIIKFLEKNFENKSKYVEYLIYKDMKEHMLIEKEIILL